MAPAAGESTVRRGDIWWVSLDSTQGSEISNTRPAVVMTKTRSAAPGAPWSSCRFQPGQLRDRPLS
jgi:mRNA-degrading endonuclease toxin of MazEF toxin-antitoxin module